jgi:hypothetical protein
MPPVPAACQPIAAEIADLKDQDAQLRAQLSTLTGAQAWAVMAQIAIGRDTLKEKQAELDACVVAHTATLQGELVVIDVGPPPAAPSRIVRILNMTGATSQVATCAVQSDTTFSFAGQLPATVAFTVNTTGDPDIVGVDFRTEVMPAANVPPSPLRIEIVLGPLARFKPEDIFFFWGALPPQALGNGRIPIATGGLYGSAFVTSLRTTLQDQALIGSVGGHVKAEGPTHPNEPSIEAPFSGGVRFRIVPRGDPTEVQIGTFARILPFVDLVFVDDWLQLAGPSGTGVALFGLDSQIQGGIRQIVSNSFHLGFNSLFRRHIPEAFALKFSPNGVTSSVRRLSISADGIEFQPVLGCFGTTLSTFVPPVVPPPV